LETVNAKSPTGFTYIYEYQLIDDLVNAKGVIIPGTGTFDGNKLTTLDIGFNATAWEAVTGGNWTFIDAGVGWALNPQLIGGQATPPLLNPNVLYVTSDWGPTWGKAQVIAFLPPGPFSTEYPGGASIPVPNAIPEGGVTLALLGFALAGVGTLRRKLGK
jgi:hypothetical protein